MTSAWRALDVWLADIVRGHKSAPNTAPATKASRAIWHIRFHNWDHLGSSVHALALKGWVASIAPASLHCFVSLTYIKWATARISGRTLQHDRKQAERAYLDWLAEGSKSITGNMHHMTRIQGGWVPSFVGLLLVFCGFQPGFSLLPGLHCTTLTHSLSPQKKRVFLQEKRVLDSKTCFFPMEKHMNDFKICFPKEKTCV